ncbi:MAG: PilN domain-containing protein [Thioploca sp.]|nr:PilN domain-containing protein [Thioploca sp.]
MPRINLLPWRDSLKKEREVRFGIITGIALGITALIFLGVHVYIANAISYQESRNNYLTEQIKEAEAKIAEIKELEQKKERLIERMSVIQELEKSRPQVVHLFDELVKQVPPGVYFTKMDQKGDKITLEGVAQSDARVSSLMSNIEISQWLSHPKIYQIVTKEQKQDPNGKGTRVSEFKLEATQTAPKSESEADKSESEKKP